MTEPTPNVIEVAKDDMYREASLWDAQSARISDCAAQAGSLTIEPTLDLFIYSGFFSEYNEVTRVFAGLCRQGSQASREIAQTLRYVADTYEEADNGIRAQYNGL